MIAPLTNPDVLKSVLASNKIQAAKSLGQNFLICEEVIDAVLLGLTGAPKNITELGPGLGTLTQGLIAHDYHVRGIEKDDEFVHILPTMLPPKLRENLTVIHGDLKDVDWTWPTPYSIVGNIPYNLSGLIIRRLTQLQTPPYCAIFLMQREVADRMVMHDKSMSLLPLSVGLWGSAELLLRVPPSCFIPQPKVHSSVVLLRPSENALPAIKREEILAKAKPFFQAKRKQIGTVLKKHYIKTTEEISAIEKAANISAERRPETLSIQEWITLCDIL